MKDMTITEARNEIAKAARMFKAFEHVDAVLTVLQGIEQNERELRERVAKLQAEAADAENRVKTVSDKAKSIGEDTEKAAAATLDKARVDAASMMSNAATQARSLVSQANTSADVAYARRDGAIAKAEEIENSLAAKREELAHLEAKLANVRAERDRLLKA